MERRKSILGSEGKEQRLIVISNRLPITCKKENGKWTFTRSSGGLVAALSGLNYSSFIWIGWPGIYIDQAEERAEVEKLLLEQNCMPVWMSADVVDGYYNGFANGVLWPLFHYRENFDYEDAWYDHYVTANQLFADAVAKMWQAEDLVWVHDYHLMLMPRMLRQKLCNNGAESAQICIGFFLHIPFPSSELYKILPVRSEILLGILDCDLIGFHTLDYARHFMQACSRIIGVETQASTVFTADRAIPVGVFPVGIEPQKFFDNLDEAPVLKRVEELKKTYSDKKVIVGVDRLDYIKGIPQKLQGLEEFFERFPEWVGKVVLIQVAVPSREDVEEYRQLKSEVDELVGRINSKYGALGYHPVQYVYHSVDFNELCALYQVAEVALITSLRDGMNLVALEYISCQEKTNGVLILSEFAGAAQSLGTSLRINPWKSKDVARAIYKALVMDADSRRTRHQALFNYVRTYTAAAWGESFVNALQGAAQAQRTSLAKLKKSPNDFARVLKSFQAHQSDKRMLLLGYDGTLVPFQTIPILAKPTSQVMRLLEELCAAGNLVTVASGRDKETMRSWFRSIPGIGLVAEFGLFYRPPNKEEWQRLPGRSADHLDWKPAVAPLLKRYAERTPGVMIEETEGSYTWNYRAAGPYGAFQAKDLHSIINSLIASDKLELEVSDTNKALEIRMNDISVGRLLQDVILKGNSEVELVVGVGDLGILPSETKLADAKAELVKCIVGQKPEKREVHLHLKDSAEVLGFLRKLVHPDKEEEPKGGEDEDQKDKKTSLASLLSSGQALA